MNAEKVKIICSELEKKEVDNMQEQLSEKLTKEEVSMYKRQKN